MKLTHLLAISATWVSLATASYGSVLVSTGFDSGYTVGNIDTQSPTDTGMTGAYTVTNTSVASVNVVSSATTGYDLTYNVVGGGTISSGSNVATFKTDSGAAQTIFSRNLSTPITGQSVYLRYVIKPITASVSGSDDIGLTLAASGIYGLGEAAPSGGGSKAGIMMEWGNYATGGTALTSGAANLLVAELIWDGTRYSQAKFWLNPTAGSSGTADGTTAVNTSGPTSLTTFALKSANMTQYTEYAFDSVVLGTTWADVVAVPEPSTYAMLFAGVAMLLIGSRKRRSVNA